MVNKEREYSLIMVVWEITHKCNLMCKTCCSFSGKALRDELSHEECLKVLNQIIEAGAKMLFFLGGEPLLHEHIVEYTKRASAAGLRVSTATNGTIITKELIKKLKEAGMEEMHFSIDGPTAELNDEIRGKGTFRKVIKGIEIAKKEGMRVTMVSVITLLTETAPVIKKLFELALKLEVDALSLERFIPTGRGAKNRYLALTKEQNKKILKLIYRNKKKLEGKLLISTGDPLKCLLDPDYPKSPYESIYGGCGAGVMSLCITPTGDVTPCPVLMIKVGNVRKDNLKNLWLTSGLFLKLRNRDNLKGKCGKCPKRNICGGCRGTAYNLRNDCLETDPMCWI